MSGPRIGDLVDLKRLQFLQDQFSKATGLTCHAIDHCGRSVTRPSGMTMLSRSLRKDSRRFTDFRNCEAHAGLQAAIAGEPRGYRCHTGLAGFAVPLHATDLYLGAALCGQVMLLDDAEELPRTHNEPTSPISPSDLDWLRTTAPLIEFERLQAAAAMLAGLLEGLVQTPPAPWSASGTAPALRRAIDEDDLPAAVSLLREHLDAVFDGAGRVGPAALGPLRELLLRLAQEVGARPPAAPDPIGRNGARIGRIEAEEQFLPLLFSIHAAGRHHAPRPRGIHDLLNQVERAPSSFLSLDSAARYLNYSPHYLSRVFKNETGMTFMDYVMRKRMERAKLLLAHSDLPVLQIAAELNFRPPNYFSRAFKQHTGVTPTHFRAASPSAPRRPARSLARPPTMKR